MRKILTFKLVILLEYQNIKIFSRKSLFQICSMGYGHMLSVIFTVKKLLEYFTKKNCKKQIKKNLLLKKAIKRKGDKLYVK